MPDVLSIRTALDKEFRPAKGDFLQTLMIELSPGRGMRTLPLNLGILLDVSSSMQGPKLENAKKACILLLQQLTAKDRATVCTFSSGAQTVVPPQLFDESVQVASCKAVESLRVSGATELLAGLEQIYQEITPHRNNEVTSYVILLSDGEPTDSQGYIDDEYSKFMDRAAKEFKDSGVSLSTIGLGSAADFNAGFLRDLADGASGQFLLAAKPEDLESTFQEEFGRIRSTVLSEATIEINRLNGAVRRFWRVVPDKKMFDAPKENNGTITLPVGAIQLDQPQAYLADIVTRAPNEPVERGLLCQVAAVTESENGQERSEANVLISYSDNEVELSQRNDEVIRLLQEANDYKLQLDLESAAKSGDRRKMTGILERKKKMTQRLGKTSATKVLENMEETLESGGHISPDDLAVSSIETKKTKRLA